MVPPGKMARGYLCLTVRRRPVFLLAEVWNMADLQDSFLVRTNIFFLLPGLP